MAEVEQVDRISNLPDALLSFILSFLSTKQAVATSILSKRWEFVWTKVPVLNFSVCYSDSANSFNAFVDRVLICNDTRSLRLFKLIHLINKDVNALHYHSWIRNIMRRDIVEIDLQLNGGILPSETFSNEKLMVLKLTGFDSPLLNPIHLPSLLTLHFTSIEFSDGFSLNDILMRLPRLEELIIQHCSGLQNICIRSSSLKRLNLSSNYSNLSSNYFRRNKNIIAIVAAPSLEFLCIDDFSSDCKFGNMPSLAEARLHIRHSFYFCVQLFKILQQVSNLMTIGLQVDRMKATLGGTEHDQLPLFPHLNHLIVSGEHCLIKCSNFSWRYLVLWILQRAPNLVSLDYSVRHGRFNNYCGCLLPRVLPTFLPELECPIPTLEVVNISLFNLVNADKMLLEYLLNNAINLKVLKMNLKGRVSGTTIAAIARLFKVPRASSVCKLVISHQE